MFIFHVIVKPDRQLLFGQDISFSEWHCCLVLFPKLFYLHINMNFRSYYSWKNEVKKKIYSVHVYLFRVLERKTRKNGWQAIVKSSDFCIWWWDGGWERVPVEGTFYFTFSEQIYFGFRRYEYCICLKLDLIYDCTTYCLLRLLNLEETNIKLSPANV